MTAPVVHGYPDWGRFASTADKYLINIGLPAPAGSTILGTFFVGDQKYLGLFIQFALQNGILHFNFYADSAGTQIFSGRDIEFLANDTFEGTIPVLGPWLIISAFSVANTATVTIQGWGQPNPGMQITGGPGGNVLFTDGGTVYAVGNTNLNTPVIWPRRAVLFVGLPAVVSAVILQAIDSAGIAQFLTEVRGNGISDWRQVYLPARHLQLTVSNAGPGAQTFRFSLTADDN